ncbi:MAG: hypothetical protein ACXVHS_05155 [Methanobacterium sp.]
MKMKFLIIIIIGIIAVIGIAGVSNLMDSKTSNATIGSDSKGYVIKDVFASNGQHLNKIAIITGIHPREKIAIEPMKTAVRNYALTHNVEVTDYDIHVLDNPDNYTIGRANGEDLAAQYIVPDIKNSDYKLVIILHAHQVGYGQGFFIATPYMDNKSVEMAQSIPNTISSFKYYKSNQTGSKTSSAIKVSIPIAENGCPTFVYEIQNKAVLKMQQI